MNGNLLTRLFAWLVRKIGRQTLLSWTLLLVALWSVIYGLVQAMRDADTRLLWLACLTGLLAGWLLARSRASGRLSAGLGVLLGLGIILGRVGQLGRHVLQLLGALHTLNGAVLSWRPGAPLPQVGPALGALGDLLARTGTLLARTVTWLADLVRAQANFDPVAAAIVWGLLLWFTSLWAAWAIRRWQKPLAAMLPAGALLASSMAYTQQSAQLLLVLLLATLLLVGQVHYNWRERSWITAGIDYPEDLGFDVGMLVVFLVAVILTVAAISPAFSPQKVNDFLNRVFKPRPIVAQPVAAPPPGKSIGESLGLVKRPPPQKEDILTRSLAGGLPREHLLGSGPELSQEVVMVIRVDQPEEPPQYVQERLGPRYYWRTLTYDIYTGRGWSSGPTVTLGYPAGQPDLVTALPAQQLVQQEVRMVGEDSQSGLLVAAGTLVAADQDYQVAWRTPPDESGASDVFGATIAAYQYRVESLIARPGVEQLKEAGTDYPDWVRKRYLQLPDTVPARVRALARDLTATEPTPYDRAHAIERYLRQYPYTLDLPNPPVNRDLVDYFLFDLRRGYCDYYASAMVVLARAAGLPARLVSGYAMGTFDANNDRYVITQADAHSWPEIYFPSYGWVEFEPTAGQSTLERPDQAASLDVPELRDLPAAPSRLLPRPGWLTLAGGLAGLLALGLVSWAVSDAWRLRRMTPAAAVNRIYRRLLRQGRKFDIAWNSGDTPYEFAALLSREMEKRSSHNNWRRFLSPASQEVRQITELYAQAAFSPRPPKPHERQHAIRIWQRLRSRMWLARLGEFFRHRLRKKNPINHNIR